MRKKIVALLTCIIIIISALCIVPISDAGSTAFNITNQTKTIEVGKTFQIKLNGVKANKIKWKSSNKSIATVSKTGTVKGLRNGKAKITGKYKDLKFVITVSVVNKIEKTTESTTQNTTEKPKPEPPKYPKQYDLVLSDDKVDIYYTGLSDYGSDQIKINFKAINKFDKIAYWGFDILYVDGVKIYDISSDEAMPNMECNFYALVPNDKLPKEIKAIIYASVDSTYAYKKEITYKLKY